ncbi:autophagy protein 13 [Podila verticillata]|nr:autophagy protein 13 [Podila verticillata]
MCGHNFYVKVIQIVILARVTHPEPHAGVTLRKGSLRGVPLIKKTSKWFNLELEDLDIYKEDAKFWRATAITESPPTMLVELMLDTSELSHNQMLVLVDENNRKSRVDVGSSMASTPGQPRTRRNIILESWSLTLSNTPPDPVPEPPVVYKKSIIFFRSLFAYMRLLPAYQLYRRLRKQNHSLKIGFRVSRGQTPEDSMLQEPEIGMEVPLIEGETRPMISEYRFGQVETPVGAFSLKVTYRSNCDFHVDESEAVLSSRFIDMDENYFTPTIVTHSQESVKSQRRQSIDNPAQRPLAAVPLSRRPSNDSYISGNFQEHFTPVTSLLPRRNSAQSLQQKSGEYSSSQSSVSSLGTRMSRRGSSGAPGGLFAPLDQQFPSGTPPFSITHGGHAAVAKHYVDPIMESPPFRLGSLFQFTPDDEDVNAFVKMMDSQEPLKMFGKNAGSGIGPGFGQGDSANLSASTLKSKTALDRFQQLKQINTSLSDSMTASQVISKDSKDRPPSLSPLTITTGSPKKSSFGDLEATSPTSLPFATGVAPAIPRHTQSLSHQPGTPSPLHSEIPVYPSIDSGARDQTVYAHSSSMASGETQAKKPSSWLIGSGIHDISRRSGSDSSNMANIAFRHGSLDQGKDILGMEDAMGKLGVSGSDEIAYGSYPEDTHHQHSLYSAPLKTARGDDDAELSVSPSSGVDPRPIPPFTAFAGSTSSRPGRLLRLGSGSSGTSFTLPRLRARAAEDNDSLNELNSVDGDHGDRRRERQRHHLQADDDDYDDDPRDLYEQDKNNQSLNDDDEMLFIMSELTPGSNSGQDLVQANATVDRGTMLPLTGALVGMRSQTQSPSMGLHGPLPSGAPGIGRSDSPHMRLFGRGNGGNNNLGGGSGNGYNNGSNSTGHSRGGSINGQGTHHGYHHSSGMFSSNVTGNVTGNGNSNSSNESLNHGVLPMMRRSGSMEDYLLPLRSNSTPPVLPPVGGVAHSAAGGVGASSGASSSSSVSSGGVINMNTPLPSSGAFEAMLEGRRMSRGGSDRGVNMASANGSGSGSGANSGGHNSYHSEGRGKIEGW